MTAHEQYADLREGDVVEYRRDEWPEGAVVRAPLEKSDFDNTLYVLSGMFGVRNDNGTPYERAATLTVVSRAPRLYVNHPRTEPVPGDVVRNADDDSDLRTWSHQFDDEEPWVLLGVLGDWKWMARDELPARLHLLIDGETGQDVPS